MQSLQLGWDYRSRYISLSKYSKYHINILIKNSFHYPIQAQMTCPPAILLNTPIFLISLLFIWCAAMCALAVEWHNNHSGTECMRFNPKAMQIYTSNGKFPYNMEITACIHSKSILSLVKSRHQIVFSTGIPKYTRKCHQQFYHHSSSIIIFGFISNSA